VPRPAASPTAPGAAAAEAPEPSPAGIPAVNACRLSWAAPGRGLRSGCGGPQEPAREAAIDDNAAQEGSTAAGGAAERLWRFLSTLPDEPCLQLLDLLERDQLAGHDFPGSGLTIRALVAVLAARQQTPPRLGNPRRCFFAVLEPFLIDEQLPRKWVGRIARTSLNHIWDWLCHDLAAAEMAAYQAEVVTALLDRDVARAHEQAAQLQKALLPAIRRAVASHDEAVLHRFSVLVGGQAVLEDLRDMMTVMEHRETLRALGERIRGPIRQLDEEEAAFILEALVPFARGDAMLLPYAVALVMGRLTHPWQILQVAVLAVESREALRLGQSSFRVVMELLLCELERLVVRAQAERRGRRTARLALAATDFAASVRAIVDHIAMGPEIGWMKRMGAARSRMAQVLRPELEELPGRVRRILRAPWYRELDGGGAFDAGEFAAIEAGLDLLVIAKDHAAELALNEATLRVISRLAAFLEASLRPLLDGLRGSVGDDRAFRLQQLEAAVRIARRVLGAEYATLLQKAVDVAAAEVRPLARAG